MLDKMAETSETAGPTRIQSLLRFPIWLSIFTVVLLSIIWVIVVRWYEASLIGEHWSQTTTEVGLRANTISLEINRRLSQITGLSAFAQSDEGTPGFEGRFNSFAESIYLNTPGIRHIALAPNVRVQYVYPLSGNNALIGYEPLKDERSEIREDIRRMLSTKHIVISGPVDLIKGDWGLVAWQPIYRQDRFWGIAEIGVDLAPSIDWAGFENPDQTLEFALLDSRGRLIYGDIEVLAEDPVIQNVELLDGNWQLVGIPSGGWKKAIETPLKVFQGVGLLLVGFITLSVYLVTDHQKRLAQAVEQRTQELSSVNKLLRDGIHERLLIDKALRESEEQLANILRVAPDAIISCSGTGDILLVNHAAEDILGYKSEEILGENIGKILPEEITQWITESEDPLGGDEHLITANNVPFTGIRKGGARFPAEGSISSFKHGATTDIIITFRDISERLQSEEAIKISENRFRGLFEQSLFAIQLFNLQGDVIGYNQAFKNQFGDIFPVIDNYNILNDPINASLGLTPAVERAMSGEIVAIPPTQLTEMHFPKMAGKPPRWIKIIMNPITDKTGAMLELAVIFEDISEQITAEVISRERELQYRSIFESVSDGLFINTLDGELVDFNPAAAHMHGYTIEEFKGIQPNQFVQPESIYVFDEYMKRIRAGLPFRGRAIDIRKDGTPFHVEVTGSRFIYQGKPHSLAVVRDVTEQVESIRLLEERVRERTREIYTLLEVSRNVASTLELRSLLTLILDQLRDVLDYHNAEIFIIEGQEALLFDQRGEEAAQQVERFDLVPDTPIYDLLKNGQPLVVTGVNDRWPLDGASSPESRKSTLYKERENQGRSQLLIPLLAKTGPIGFLKLTHSQPGYYRQGQADLAQAFASQVAVALENARLYEQAQSLASIQERQKLARELHDSVSQALYGIALGARTARTLLDRQVISDEVKGMLEEPLDYVLDLADAGLAEMRALIFELRPESLETEGLVVALTKQAAALKSRHQLDVVLDLCPEPEISLSAKETLYRVVQEATHNTVKHAGATQINLNLRVEGKYLCLEIWDNGSGFNPNDDFPGHLGLRSMRERMERIQGDLKIASTPGSGTVISARIPYPIINP